MIRTKTKTHTPETRVDRDPGPTTIVTRCGLPLSCVAVAPWNDAPTCGNCKRGMRVEGVSDA